MEKARVNDRDGMWLAYTKSVPHVTQLTEAIEATKQYINTRAKESFQSSAERKSKTISLILIAFAYLAVSALGFMLIRGINRRPARDTRDDDDNLKHARFHALHRSALR